MEITLKVKPREEKGKGPARRARAAGAVPGVLYGKGMDSVPVAVDTKEMHKALATESGLNVLINLQLDSKTKYLTMLREVQRSPVRGDLLHVDFLKIDRDVKIQADVPVHIVGESHGVREGGVVEHHLWEIKVEALPGDVPTAIEVDITPLGIDQHIRVSDIATPPNTEILTPLEEIIVSVVEPQVIQIEEPEAVPAEGEEVPEGEAPPEGAPEGEQAPPPEGEEQSS